MNLNLDFYNNFYKNNTKYNNSSNIKYYAIPTTSISSTEEKQINGTTEAVMVETAITTEIPVISNEVYNRMFPNNNKNKNTNNKIIEFLQKNETKTFEYYRNIKLRDLKEYTDLLIYQFDLKINQKKETEKTMFIIKKFVDYMKSTNNGIYLGGFENKYKIDEVTIPDLIGITKKEKQVLNENIQFIFDLINTFFGSNKINKLFECINELIVFFNEYINPKQSTSTIFLPDPENNIFISETDYTQKNINTIQNINNLYFLLSSLLDNSKFNFNKFIGSVKLKKNNKVSGGAVNSNLIKFLIEKKNKNKKNKNKKSLLSTNKKTDDMDKKVKYILSYEAILNSEINPKKYEDLKEKLRKTWWKEKFDYVLKDSLVKLKLDQNYKKIPKLLKVDGTDYDLTTLTNLSTDLKTGNIDTIIKKLKGKNSSSSKDDIYYLNEILKNMFNNPESLFLEIYDPQKSRTNKFLSLIDFYTSKKINTSEIIKADDNIDIIQKIYSTYEKNYQNYQLQDLLPEKSNVQEQKDQQIIGINILRGIGNYCNIARKFINNTLKRISTNDVMRNKLNRIKKEEPQQQPQQQPPEQPQPQPQVPKNQKSKNQKDKKKDKKEDKKKDKKEDKKKDNKDKKKKKDEKKTQ
jgi:hypothetical protein